MSEEKQEQQVEHVEAIAVSANALQQMERASIDIQIATAKQYPRSIKKFLDNSLAMVTLNPEVAASCIYNRPVGKEKNEKTGKWEMKYAEGMSIRLAEIVVPNYTNLRISGVITEMSLRYVKAVGTAFDVESNTAIQKEVVESTVTKDGVPFSDRMRVVVAKSTQMKAIRDASLFIIPKSLLYILWEAAKKVALGDAKSFESRRKGVVSWIQSLKIEPKRVWDALGIEGEEDITMELLITLAGIKTALDDKDVTVDDAFPKTESEAGKGSTTDRIKNKFKDKEESGVQQTQTAPADPASSSEEPKAENPKDKKATPKKAEVKPKEEPKPEHQYKCERCERTAPEGGECKYCYGAMLKIKK